MLTDIQDLYDYNRWANQRTLEVTARLSPAQLGRDLESSFPSVHDTLVHMMGAEWVWLARWKGSSPPGLPESWDLSTHEALVGAWSVVEADLDRFVQELTDEKLEALVHFKNPRGKVLSNPLHRLMRHLANHSSYHRGQIATMLRQLGLQAVPTDMVLFYLERDGQLEG